MSKNAILQMLALDKIPDPILHRKIAHALVIYRSPDGWLSLTLMVWHEETGKVEGQLIIIWWTNYGVCWVDNISQEGTSVFCLVW